jgi:hypothetical protein
MPTAIILMAIASLFLNIAIAAPGAALEARDTFQCCRCADNDVSANACAGVNFGLCGNSNSACGIWVGHANDITDFANACVAIGSSFGECA